MKNSFKFSLVAAAAVVSMTPILSVAADTYDISWDSANSKAVYSKNGGDNQDIEWFFDNSELENQSYNTITINLGSNTFDNSVFGGLNLISDISDNNITFQSGIINGKLTGGSSAFGKVFNNTIVVKNSEVKSDIIGGNGDSSEVSGNKIILENAKAKLVLGGNGDSSEVSGNKIILENAKAKLVYGGYSSGSGKVSGNKVIINDSTIGDGKSGKVYGGYGNDNGSVENNEVIIQGGTFDDIYGGHSRGSESKFNKVTIQNANTGFIYGGSAWRNASDNEIIIKNSTTGGIEGGFSQFGGDASRNKIYISSSSVGGIYGGLSNTGNAIDNTITLQIDTTKRPTNISGAIYGGFVGEPINQDCKTGNTLNIGESQFLPLTNMNLLKAKNIYNFETINFYLPNSVSNGQVALSLSDTKPTDLTNVKVNAYLSNASNLIKDSKIHLIQVPDGGAIENFNEANGNANLSNVNIAGLINVTGKIAVDNTAKNLDLTFNGDPSGGGSGGGSSSGGGATANANSKQLLENSLAGMIAVSESINNLVSNLDNLGSNEKSSSSSSGNANANIFQLNNISAFANTNGHNKRFITGSHVDSKGFSLSSGIVKNDYFDRGDLTTGLFLEYGKGKYESVLDNGLVGEGKTEFIGGGVFGKFKFINNYYTEASARIGNIKTKAEKGIYDEYKLSNIYYGAHLGVGKIYEITSSNELDIYAKYFHSYVAGDNIELSGVSVDLGSVTFSKFKTGFKDTIKFSDTSSLYAGLAYQYEAKGDAKGSLSAFNQSANIASPSLKGSTGIGEIGYIYEMNSIKFDIGAKGYAGKEKGYSGNLGVTFKF